MSATPYSRKQLAIRRILLDGRGELNRDAKVLVADFRRFCRADGQPLLIYSPQSGNLDATATVAAAARREVFDRYLAMLCVDQAVVMNVKDEN